MLNAHTRRLLAERDSRREWLRQVRANEPGESESEPGERESEPGERDLAGCERMSQARENEPGEREREARRERRVR